MILHELFQHQLNPSAYSRGWFSYTRRKGSEAKSPEGVFADHSPSTSNYEWDTVGECWQNTLRTRSEIVVTFPADVVVRDKLSNSSYP
jgi:hypothetical protein